jgi:hypothetical protein
MSVGTAFLGSARFQRASDGILPSRTLRGAYTGLKFARNKSPFRRHAETSTLKACAPQPQPQRPQWTCAS